MYFRQSAEEQQFLMDVAMGRKAPTLVIVGGQILNVYTGRLEQKDIVVAGRRIAFVGRSEQSGVRTDASTKIFNASGKILVPGYIEPHAHPFQLYQPVSLAEKVLPLGTTTLIHDNLFFFAQLEDEKMLSILKQLDNAAVKHFWWARLDPQTHLAQEKQHLFSYERVREFLSHPLVLQAGELTDWLPLLQEDPTMSTWISDAKKYGKRVEGHAPGASYRTLSRLAAAGVTGDHESISVEEVWNRLELGYMVTLRHSSIRPDLPQLIKGLLEKQRVPWHRLMMTTDGVTPLYLKPGFTDYLIHTAIESGCDPIHAYQMVTINPAVYYHLDEHLGGIAPGRLADINLLASLESPTPVTVFAEGEKVADKGKCLTQLPQLDGELFAKLRWRPDFRLSTADFSIPCEQGRKFPVIQMVNAVITKMTEETLVQHNGQIQWAEDDDRLLAFLVDRHGKWITPGVIHGFAKGIDGLASSYTGSHDLLVIGRDPEMMAEAANRVLEQGGGIVWIQDQSVYMNLSLPIAGWISRDPIDQLITQLEPFVDRLRAFGYPYSDPLYSFLFLSSTHLPQVRLTANGLMRVKDKKILYPAVQRG
ncbi:adenine deaminase C-terminal domain-containing protein [Paenactinomyces guangxiensis]|uniref:adenine deaminase n=1 Tax=Paenactinomyces guangxiensis TaxID=1490290 RepID=A0A7W1WT26_9BACL|nr:adenine deaminase C-terminal domain-containing protein [Paenactinomyces guangxiensis]MBA4495478.1 adenine deaminase [Paenactinomyces guangxiensis]MBH8592399.1 adenine deaminase [Paenactinomyces guangxiensis]